MLIGIIVAILVPATVGAVILLIDTIEEKYRQANRIAGTDDE